MIYFFLRSDSMFMFDTPFDNNKSYEEKIDKVKE